MLLSTSALKIFKQRMYHVHLHIINGPVVVKVQETPVPLGLLQSHGHDEPSTKLLIHNNTVPVPSSLPPHWVRILRRILMRLLISLQMQLEVGGSADVGGAGKPSLLPAAAAVSPGRLTSAPLLCSRLTSSLLVRPDPFDTLIPPQVRLK